MEKPNRSSLRPPRDVRQSQDWELGLLAPRPGTALSLNSEGSFGGSLWPLPCEEEGRQLRHSWAARSEAMGPLCHPQLLSQVKQHWGPQKQGSSNPSHGFLEPETDDMSLENRGVRRTHGIPMKSVVFCFKPSRGTVL